jgi:hypothetical protein
MLVTGIEPSDATAAVVLALGAATGLALVAISIHMRGGDIYSA